MKQKQIKNRTIQTLLDFLDKKIEEFYQKRGNYPKKIKISLPGQNKIFSELAELTLDNSWRDTQDNYRGIKIEINNIEDIKLE